jgi:hypothetical protein
MLEVGQDLARDRGEQDARGEMLDGAGDRRARLTHGGDGGP